jgi:hypothetical protein
MQLFYICSEVRYLVILYGFPCGVCFQKLVYGNAMIYSRAAVASDFLEVIGNDGFEVSTTAK